MELQSLTTDESASRLGEHLATCDFPEVARVAEMLARCSLMSVSSLATAVGDAARMTSRMLAEARPAAKPRQLAFAAVQLCSAGFADEAVFAAVADRLSSLAEGTFGQSHFNTIY